MISWATVTEYTVGGLDAPGWAEFGDVESAGFDDAGNLYILDGQTNEVTVVSPEGEYLRTVGRKGEGPGEVQQAMGMVVRPAGGVLIPDFGHRALVGYGPDGEWTGNVSVNLAREGLPAGGAVALRDGRVVATQGFRVTMSEDDGEGDAMDIPDEGQPIWAWPARDGEEASVIYTAWQSPPPPDDDAQEISGSTAEGGQVQLRFGPLEAFAPEVQLAPLPDGSMAVVDSTAYRIDLVGPDGTVRGEVTRPIDPIPVTDRIRAEERDLRLAELEEREGGQVRFPGGSGASFGEGVLQDALRARIESMLFYPEIPVIEDISADWSGKIWVQRSSGEPGVDGPTDVVRADGSYVGTLPADGLRIPEAFGPGGLAAYIEEDEFGVETVRVVRIVEGA
jgi:hypothetical protein